MVGSFIHFGWTLVAVRSSMVVDLHIRTSPHFSKTPLARLHVWIEAPEGLFFLFSSQSKESKPL
jgi:hypothetical protein